MPSLKHVHTYKKHPLRKGFMMCADAHCTHIENKKLLLGKANKCPFCSNEFELTSEDLKRALPRCIDCSDTIKARQRKAAKQIIANVFDNAELKEVLVGQEE